jgi:hypothetical protein
MRHVLNVHNALRKKGLTGLSMYLESISSLLFKAKLIMPSIGTSLSELIINPKGSY